MGRYLFPTLGKDIEKLINKLWRRVVLESLNSRWVSFYILYDGFNSFRRISDMGFNFHSRFHCYKVGKWNPDICIKWRLWREAHWVWMIKFEELISNNHWQQTKCGYFHVDEFKYIPPHYELRRGTRDYYTLSSEDLIHLKESLLRIMNKFN